MDEADGFADEYVGPVEVRRGGFGAEGVVAEVGVQLVLVPVPPVEEVVAQQSPVIGRSNPFAESNGCDPETNTKYAHGPRKMPGPTLRCRPDMDAQRVTSRRSFTVVAMFSRHGLAFTGIS